MILIRFLIIFCSCVLAAAACGAKRTGYTPAPETGRLKATQRPYTVNGKRYEPLRSHAGFVQEGIASWYGRDFHGKLTSNGERYDMHAMTAAHKTLPLGVFVRVRCKLNGHEVVVRVNDRGPFVKGRVIDLSHAAAQKLGIDMTGTAPVKVEALGYRADGPAAQAQYDEPATYETGSYTVQIGSFADVRNANRLSEEMKKLYGFSDVRQTTVNHELFYRVYAGKYTSLNDAETAEGKFIDQGYPGSFSVALE